MSTMVDHLNNLKRFFQFATDNIIIKCYILLTLNHNVIKAIIANIDPFPIGVYQSKVMKLFLYYETLFNTV